MLVPLTVNTVFVTGDDVILLALDPVLHVYVPAPLALRVAVAPLQIVAELTEMVGFEFTVIVLTAVFELTQPAALVPVRE